MSKWKKMCDWTEEEWEEYLSWLYPSQDTVLKDLEDVINNSKEQNNEDS